MQRYVTFGEVMLRLKSPGRERILQNPLLEATFGGGEANVAVGLARFGLDAAFVSLVPDNPVGDACVAELRKHGVDTSGMVRKGRRLGIYFLETGSNQRPSKIVYDRAGSSVSEVKSGDIEWKTVLKGAAWFHITGLTPAVSHSAAEASMEAVETAKAMGLTVSCDLNYRSMLWKYGKSAPEVMGRIAERTDLLIGNEEDFQKSLAIPFSVDLESGKLSTDAYRALAEKALDRYPNVRRVAITLRSSRSADHNGWQAVLHNRERFLVSTQYEIGAIVDRVGSGDSFTAGLIYGLSALGSDQDALEFAVASGCLKHTIPGDFPVFLTGEVEALRAGKGSGRIQR